MESPTSSASCPPCSDSPLAITTSVITFLTFLYAITVGLVYYYGLAKSSPEEIKKFIEALSGSLRELYETGGELVSTVLDIPDQDEDENKITREMKAELETILRQLKRQVDLLNHFRWKVDKRENHSSRSARWFEQSSRMYYILIREELQQKVVEKDRLMTDLRHLHQRVLKIGSDRLEKEHREKQYEMLELIRAERAEDAKLQDTYRKEQDTLQLEQLQMLESILRRVIRLEAREKTSTQDKTSSSDPLP